MSGTLYVVATPIGNLEDITLRALRVLREADLIAAEDTRRTAKLLTHHAIPTRTISFHEHNSRTRLPQLLARLQEGGSVALVTDAGTPGVSDPGAELVSACVAAGIPVDPIPGVSAPLTAVVASGFPVLPLTILGFPPQRSKDRTYFISNICSIDSTVTFFEAPHRIQMTLRQLSNFSGNRQIMLGRELTKAHQEFLFGTASELADRMDHPKGEFTVVMAPMIKEEILEMPEDSVVAKEFGRLTDLATETRRGAIAKLAEKYGQSARDIYSAIERAKEVRDQNS